MWWNDYWPGPWMFFGPLMMFLFVMVCVAVVFFMLRGGSRGGHAIDVLKERFARGEINRAEFEERRRLLDS